MPTSNDGPFGPTRASLWMVVALLLPLAGRAESSGHTGASGKNGTTCTGCHLPSGNTPTVAFQGPSTVVAGMTSNYSFTIQGGPGVNAGVDLAVGGSNGTVTLSPGLGMRVANNELTHSSPATFRNGLVTYNFSLTGSTPGVTFTLYGNGLSANGDGSQLGDHEAKTTMAITVVAAGTDAGVPAVDGGLPTGTVDGGVPADGGTKVGTEDAGSPASGVAGSPIPLDLPPVVNLLTAALGTAPLQGSVMLRATATAPGGISKVCFFLDGDELGVVTTPAYNLDFNTTVVPNGPHQLLVQAWSTSGLTTKTQAYAITVANPEDSNPLGCNAAGGAFPWAFLASLGMLLTAAYRKVRRAGR